jgi:hypothetical protein
MSKVLGTSMSFIITIFQNKDKLSRMVTRQTSYVGLLIKGKPKFKTVKTSDT